MQISMGDGEDRGSVRSEQRRQACCLVPVEAAGATIRYKVEKGYEDMQSMPINFAPSLCELLGREKWLASP
jgi:hypothetical protein